MSELSATDRIDRLCELLKAQAVANRLSGWPILVPPIVDHLIIALEGRCDLINASPTESYEGTDRTKPLTTTYRFHFYYDHRR